MPKPTRPTLSQVGMFASLAAVGRLIPLVAGRSAATGWSTIAHLSIEDQAKVLGGTAARLFGFAS